MEIRSEKAIKFKGIPNEIKTIKRMVTICANCKQIKDDNGSWNQMISDHQRHLEVCVSHGLCPVCVRKLYPELYAKQLNEA